MLSGTVTHFHFSAEDTLLCFYVARTCRGFPPFNVLHAYTSVSSVSGRFLCIFLSAFFSVAAAVSSTTRMLRFCSSFFVERCLLCSGVSLYLSAQLKTVAKQVRAQFSLMTGRVSTPSFGLLERKQVSLLGELQKTPFNFLDASNWTIVFSTTKLHNWQIQRGHVF